MLLTRHDPVWCGGSHTGKSTSRTWELVDRAHPKQKISLVFAVKQNREAVHEVPESPSFSFPLPLLL